MANIIAVVIALVVTVSGFLPFSTTADKVKYPIVDTNQTQFYGKSDEIAPQKPGKDYYGQDANFEGNKPSYKDNGDGTITDNVTGLMWVKARGSKVSWEDALAGAKKSTAGNYNDWRMPTIKELYSLIEFTGKCRSFTSTKNCIPYLDTNFFEFKYGETSKGERIIDCQDWSSTTYVSTTMNGNPTAFGVNFADGRIKGYPKETKDPRGNNQRTNKLYVRYVRGNTDYGKNELTENNDKTITDAATGLMWSKDDSGKGMIWKDALAWVQKKNKEKYLGYNDWRLPNAKELQSIVDYTRSPDTTDSPAIDPVFDCTKIKNEGNQDDYPFYWTGTTHLDNMGAVYVCFGRGLGFMTFGPPPKPMTTMSNQPSGDPEPKLMDVHGAGCQRSDPKDGNPADYPVGKGPQGDVIRILNYVRLVRNI